MRCAFKVATLASTLVFAIAMVWMTVVITSGRHRRVINFNVRHQFMTLSGGRVIGGTSAESLCTDRTGIYLQGQIIWD